MRNRVSVKIRVRVMCVRAHGVCVFSCTGGGQMRWARGGAEVGVRSERGGKG